jgi:predicted AAA+ superfamily ATPase
MWKTRKYEDTMKSVFAQFPAVVVTFIFRPCPIWFWRTARGDEVDLIIEKDGRFTTTECKYAKAISSSGLKGLNAFTETYGHENNRNCYVASRTATEHPWS